MKIELKEITVRDVAEGYQDSAEKGVTGYGGKLNIRPAFQREFVYGQKERDAVLDTVMKGFPLMSCTGVQPMTAHLSFWTDSSARSACVSM